MNMMTDKSHARPVAEAEDDALAPMAEGILLTLIQQHTSSFKVYPDIYKCPVFFFYFLVIYYHHQLLHGGSHVDCTVRFNCSSNQVTCDTPSPLPIHLRPSYSLLLATRGIEIPDSSTSASPHLPHAMGSRSLQHASPCPGGKCELYHSDCEHQGLRSPTPPPQKRRRVHRAAGACQSASGVLLQWLVKQRRHCDGCPGCINFINNNSIFMVSTGSINGRIIGIMALNIISLDQSVPLTFFCLHNLQLR
jgi:hypothetical protein